MSISRLTKKNFHHRSVDVLGGVGVVNTLDLDQAGSRAGGVTRALVAQVTSPKPSSVQNSYRIVVVVPWLGFAEIRYRKKWDGSVRLSKQTHISDIACVPGLLDGESLLT